jgi:hypothetical protein
MPKILVQREMVIEHRTIGVRKARVDKGEVVEVTEKELAQLNPRWYLLQKEENKAAEPKSPRKGKKK